MGREQVITLINYNLFRGPVSALTINTSSTEVLSCEWNKYNEFLFYSAGASADPTIKVWDLRNSSVPVKVLSGHQFGIRRVCSSPHNGDLLLSTGYDMTTKLWNLSQPSQNKLLRSFDHHAEFVFGLDFSLFIENQVVSASWDEHVSIFSLIGPQIPPIPKKISQNQGSQNLPPPPPMK